MVTLTVIKLLRPRPSLDVIKNWKSIVELILRGVTIFLALCCLITCSIVEDKVTSIDGDLDTRSDAAAGWGIFLCFIAMVIQGVIIVMRFLNFDFTQNYLKVSQIVDLSVSGVLAFLLFITGIPLAVYGNEWNDVADDNPDFTKETGEAARSLQAASAFSFFTMIAFIALLVWMLLHLIFGWCKSSAVSHQTDSAI